MVFHTTRQPEASTDQGMISIPTFMSGLCQSENWAGVSDLFSHFL